MVDLVEERYRPCKTKLLYRNYSTLLTNNSLSTCKTILMWAYVVMDETNA